MITHAASVSLFGEPYRITINQPEAADGSRNGLLLGLAFDVDNGLTGLVLLEDGTVTRLNTYMWSVDFRYDVETDRWTDSNRSEPDQEG